MSRTNEELILGVYTNEINVEDLSDEELDIVLSGFEAIAAELMKKAETFAAGEAIQAVLDELNNDEFDEAIEEAESRGSTYWEFETPHIH